MKNKKITKLFLYCALCGFLMNAQLEAMNNKNVLAIWHGFRSTVSNFYTASRNTIGAGLKTIQPVFSPKAWKRNICKPTSRFIRNNIGPCGTTIPLLYLFAPHPWAWSLVMVSLIAKSLYCKTKKKNINPNFYDSNNNNNDGKNNNNNLNVDKKGNKNNNTNKNNNDGKNNSSNNTLLEKVFNKDTEDTIKMINNERFTVGYTNQSISICNKTKFNNNKEKKSYTKIFSAKKENIAIEIFRHIIIFILNNTIKDELCKIELTNDNSKFKIFILAVNKNALYSILEKLVKYCKKSNDQVLVNFGISIKNQLFIDVMAQFCPKSKMAIWKKIVKAYKSVSNKTKNISHQETFIKLVYGWFAGTKKNLNDRKYILKAILNKKLKNYLVFINNNAKQPKKEDLGIYKFIKSKKEYLEKMWTIIEALATDTNGIRSLICHLHFIKYPSQYNEKTPCIVIGYDKKNKAKLINALAALFPEILPVKEEMKLQAPDNLLTTQLITAMKQFCPESKKDIWKEIVKRYKSEIAKKANSNKPAQELFIRLVFSWFAPTESSDILKNFSNKDERFLTFINNDAQKIKKQQSIPFWHKNKEDCLEKMWTIIKTFAENKNIRSLIYGLSFIKDPSKDNNLAGSIIACDQTNEKILKEAFSNILPKQKNEEKTVKKEENKKEKKKPTSVDELLENLKKKKLTGFTVTEKEDNSFLEELLGSYHSKGIKVWQIYNQQTKTKSKKALTIPCNKKSFLPLVTEFLTLLEKNTDLQNAINLVWIPKNATDKPFLFIWYKTDKKKKVITRLKTAKLLKQALDDKLKQPKEKASKPMSYDDQKNFFKTIMGIEEPAFRSNKENIIKNAAIFKKNKASKEILTLKNLKTKQTYQAGYFEQISIEQLKDKTKKLKGKKGGSFSVIQGTEASDNMNVKENVDVAALQADPKNKDAVFQVASNFNGLEFKSSAGLQMQNITSYYTDKTQGPAASVSAAPGTILRQYYVFRNNKNLNNPIAWAQTKNNQINFLDNKGVNLTTTNGYVQLNDKSLNDSHDYTKVKIGWQGDTQVTFGGTDNIDKIDTPRHKLVPDDRKQIIHQVFTAAVNLTLENNFEDKKKKQKAEKIAKELLNAAYEGTIRAAAAHGKKKVFLTLVGGGAFSNNLSWIIDAIEKQVPLIKQFDLDVTLVIFDGRGLSSNYNNQKTLKEKLIEMTFNGHYIEYKPNQILVDAKEKK